ncbi:hypothetical protein DFH06DRAFT_1302443 [Mycena polygramma]|nr:hypothetical protein DFH06DRAFT_1302443 [Mycena polygramma]
MSQPGADAARLARLARLAAEAARRAADEHRRAADAALAHVLSMIADLPVPVPAAAHRQLANGLLDASFGVLAQAVADSGLSGAVLLALRQPWRAIHQPPELTVDISPEQIVAAASWAERAELLERADMEDVAFVMAADLYMVEARSGRVAVHHSTIGIDRLFSHLSVY